MSVIDTAAGSVDPGEFINYESASYVLPLMLRMFQGLHTGDFEIKRTSDGITYNNAGNNITNVANTTDNYGNDDSDPLYARIAGSWANMGAMVFIGPRGKTHADVDYWELCFRRYNTATGLDKATVNGSIPMTVAVSCNGGWNNISNALAMPTPRTSDDPITRIDGSFGIDQLMVLNGFVTNGETTAPGAGFTIHNKGSNTVYFSLRIDWTQHDTLDRLSADTSKRDLYHPTVTIEGWGGEQPCAARFMTNATITDLPLANNAIGACTRFGNGKTTTCATVPWALEGFLPASGHDSASRIGKNTISGNEPLNPFCYIRPGGVGSARGSGQKGVGTHFWFTGDSHELGDTPYVTSPGDRPYYCAQDVVFRNAGQKIYR